MIACYFNNLFLSQNMNIIGNFYNFFVTLIKYPANLSLNIADPEMWCISTEMRWKKIKHIKCLSKN